MRATLCANTLSKRSSGVLTSNNKIVNAACTSQNRQNQVVQHNKRMMPYVQNNADEEIFFVQVPASQPGQEYDLNWSLAKVQINPAYEAFRNAQPRHLIMRAYGKTDKNKALVVDAPARLASESFDKIVTEKKSTWANDVKDLSTKFHRRAHRDVSYYLSNVPYLFVQDGDAGSYRGNNVRVRAVSDNAVSGLFLKHMILPIKLGLANTYDHEVTVLHAPGYQFTPEHIVDEFGGPKPSDLGLSREKFVLTNEGNNSTIISSVQDNRLVLDALTFHSGKVAFQKTGSLILPSDSIVSREGRVTLVFGNTADDVAGLYSSDDFVTYGAHHNVIGQDGLSRVWNGISVETSRSNVTTNLEDLVEVLDDKTVRLTRRQNGVIPNLVNKPNDVVILVKDPNFAVPALSSITQDRLADLLASGLVAIEKDQPAFRQAFSSTVFTAAVHPSQVVARLKELLGNTQAYLVNSAYDSKTVRQAVSLVTSGQAKGISGSDIVDGVKVLKHASIKDNAWKDEQKLKQALDTLFQRVKQAVPTLSQ